MNWRLDTEYTLACSQAGYPFPKKPEKISGEDFYEYERHPNTLSRQLPKSRAKAALRLQFPSAPVAAAVPMTGCCVSPEFLTALLLPYITLPNTHWAGFTKARPLFAHKTPPARVGWRYKIIF
jgi:hypothetical protein